MNRQTHSVSSRRRAIRFAYVNAALWSVGNGLTTGTIVYYLLLDLGASGLKLSPILALPALIGLLRILSPQWIRWCGGNKPAATRTFIASYLLLFVVPVSMLPGVVPRERMLELVIGLICLHQLLEYIAQVALLSWLADLVPLPVRGRFFGRRNRWQLAVLIPTLLVSGYFADWWRSAYRADPQFGLLGYAMPLALGACFLLLSVWPLVRMPRGEHVEKDSIAPPRDVVPPTFLAPLKQRSFRQLLTYRAWFSLSNGITQAAQNIFPYAVLRMGIWDLAMMRTTMQIGQFAISPAVGRAADRVGNRPVLVLSQLVVAASLVFFLIASNASPLSRWLIGGAWILWSAYAGINVALYNLMLKLPPTDRRPPYVAMHEAVGSIFYAVATLTGGYLLDRLRLLDDSARRLTDPANDLRVFAGFFAVGIAMRLLAAVLAARIEEPGAWRLRDLLRRRSGSAASSS